MSLQNLYLYTYTTQLMFLYNHLKLEVNNYFEYNNYIKAYFILWTRPAHKLETLEYHETSSCISIFFCVVSTNWKFESSNGPSKSVWL